MNNSSKIVLINENGVQHEYGAIPDLWHLAEQLRAEDRPVSAEAVLHIWHMCHDLKAVIEKQGEARIVSADNFSDAKPNAFQATAENGVTFIVRIVNPGDKYGLKMCLTHDGREPLIEFYDAKYTFTEFGQFISRYCLSTLLESPHHGLNLDGGVPAWSIDPATFNVIKTKLTELIK